ncbi:MAG: hypothetical protein QNJ00_16425 [Woeseiaceae bacterium]|nr:hypothetical protein [Woeseiaceae bacterium]
MSSIGRFLEFSVRTPDILDSLHFYKTLGFEELTSSDIWPHKYAVVSDGALSIGLHDREFDDPALTFVQPELARHARRMSDHGFDFSHMQLGEEIFNELRLQDRDHHTIMMLEARTFYGADEDDNDSLLGSWFEVTLPVRDAMRSARFWAPIAPVMLSMREEPTPHLRFDAGGIAIGLSESIALSGPSLCFKCRDRDAVVAVCERHGHKTEKYPGYEGAFRAIQAPEGTTLYLFDEDFLGEAIVVDESDDLSEYPG